MGLVMADETQTRPVRIRNPDQSVGVPSNNFATIVADIWYHPERPGVALVIKRATGEAWFAGEQIATGFHELAALLSTRSGKSRLGVEMAEGNYQQLKRKLRNKKRNAARIRQRRAAGSVRLLTTVAAPAQAVVAKVSLAAPEPESADAVDWFEEIRRMVEGGKSKEKDDAC